MTRGVSAALGAPLGMLLALVLTVALAGCGGGTASTQDQQQAPPGTVRVAAASDLRFALDSVVQSFQQQHPDIRIVPTYGSSGNFYAQLNQGAPFDVFLSADVEYPRRLEQAGLTAPNSLFDYAIGDLVVWADRSKNLDVQGRGLQVVLDPAVRKVSIANPEHAPYGRAAVAALKSTGLYEQVQPKLVYGENITQAADFAVSGAADVGLVALSLAMSPNLADRGDYTEVPANTYPRIEQGGAIMKNAADVRAAEQFTGYLTSAEGQAELKKFGFLPADGS